MQFLYWPTQRHRFQMNYAATIKKCAAEVCLQIMRFDSLRMLQKHLSVHTVVNCVDSKNAKKPRLANEQ